MKSRVVIIFAAFCFLWCLLLARAAYLQIWPHERLENLKRKLFETTITMDSRRGAIVDRNSKELAVSNSAYSLFADPYLLEEKKQVTNELSRELNIPFNQLWPKLKQEQKRFVWIKRLLDRATAEKIKEKDIRGLGFVEEWKRIYPNESLGAQILGFVGGDGAGIEGLELKYNKLLQGNKKKIAVRRDARGRPLMGDGLLFSENPDGAEVQLTIDSEIQYVLEDELQRATTDFNAESAVGVVLDAETSEIIAMASSPTFDINNPNEAKPFQKRNRAITDSFEPGSTMKTFVIATGLREKTLKPNKKYNTENGKLKIGKRLIREAETDHAWESLTVSEILAYSSNVGATKISFELGADVFRQGLEDFGFGSGSGVDLPGEASGILRKLPWKAHFLSNVSFGHGIAATPLQVANAYAAIANGGVLKRPFIIKKIKDPDNNKVEVGEEKEIRRVLSEEDSQKMREMLMKVVEDGSGQNAQVPGYKVAGKTGTAQKVNPHGRGYMENAYISSFAGFIPAKNPKFVVYIAVDHPRKAYYGSQVAAPIFSRVASFAARKAGIAPTENLEKTIITSNENKNKSALNEGFKFQNIEDLKNKYQIKKMDTVPNFMGLTYREVLRKVQGSDLTVNFRGRGVVSQISPEVGSPLNSANKSVEIILTE